MQINQLIIEKFKSNLEKSLKENKDINSLFLKDGGQLIKLSKKGEKLKIKIKDSQKGSFTKYCNGKVTQDCINKGKNSSNPKIRKKAIFAESVRKWNH